MVFVGFGIVIALSLFVIVVWEMKAAASSRERFPPLSDAEFVARCAPGTDPAVALRVRKVISEALNIDPADIYPSSRLIGDLGA